MGQYHYPINWTRREYLNPARFGDGHKLLEFGCSRDGTLLGLTVLLAAQNRGGERGGGDLHPWHGGPGYAGRENPMIISEEYETRLMDFVVGRWANDSIAIHGDYYNEATEIPEGLTSPWGNPENWTDISLAVLQTINLDFYVREGREKRNTTYLVPEYLFRLELVGEDGSIVSEGVTA